MRQTAFNLMRTAPAVYLSTVNAEGFPETRAMLNLCNADLYPSLRGFFAKQDPFAVYLTTNTSSAKAGQMNRDGKISLYYCNPSKWLGLMICGEVLAVKDAGIISELWQDEWKMYYPSGWNDPDHSVFSIVPVRAKLYSSFSVHEII